MITNLFNGLNNKMLGMTYQYNQGLDIISNPMSKRSEYSNYSQTFKDFLAPKSVPNEMAKSYNANNSNAYAAEYKGLKEKISQRSTDTDTVKTWDTKKGSKEHISQDSKIRDQQGTQKNTKEDKKIDTKEHSADEISRDSLQTLQGDISEKDAIRLKLKNSLHKEGVDTLDSMNENKSEGDIKHALLRKGASKLLTTQTKDNSSHSVDSNKGAEDEDLQYVHRNFGKDGRLFVDNMELEALRDKGTLLTNQGSKQDATLVPLEGLVKNDSKNDLKHMNSKLSDKDLMKLKLELRSKAQKSHKDNKHLVEKLIQGAHKAEHEREEGTAQPKLDAHSYENKQFISQLQDLQLSKSQAVNQVHQYLRNEGTRDIVQHARVILQNEQKGEIKILLHPKEYGEIKMNFILEDNKIAAKVVVSNEVARDAFQKNIDNLERMLNFEGFEVASIFVSVDSNTSENNNGERMLEDKNVVTKKSPNGISQDLIQQHYIGIRSELIDIVA